MFRTVPYNGANKKVIREKWKLVGQRLSRVCSKRCIWLNVQVRAASPNVCKFTTIVKEAIIYWIFVSEGEDSWIQEFKGNKKNYLEPEGEEDNKTIDDANTSTSRKKYWQHKTVTYLPHWWQCFELVKKKCENREILEAWDNAWMAFAIEELECKKEGKYTKKKKIKDVLPTFEDVLGVGDDTAISSYLSCELVTQ
jgi:hypothetical protein